MLCINHHTQYINPLCCIYITVWTLVCWMWTPYVVYKPRMLNVNSGTNNPTISLPRTRKTHSMDDCQIPEPLCSKPLSVLVASACIVRLLESVQSSAVVCIVLRQLKLEDCFCINIYVGRCIVYIFLWVYTLYRALEICSCVNIHMTPRKF